MTIKTIKNNKKILLITVISFVVVLTLILTTSLAKYKVTQSIKIVEGTINYSSSDFNLMGMYIESDNGYVSTDTVPDEGYVLNETESYCKIGDTVQDVTISYDANTKTLNIAPMTTKGMKCYLYFDGTNAKNYILSNITTVTTRNITGINNANTTGIIFTAEDDDGDSYYFSGNPTDNYFYFGGFYWRIIRINGDGSIRLIYQGKTANASGLGAQISTSAFNSTNGDNTYVGYMTGVVGANNYNNAHSNSTNSIIKGVLDNWYDSNLTNYNDYIDANSGFCNDRLVSKVSWGGYDTTGYGTNWSVYAPTDRVLSNSWSWLTKQSPTFKCIQTSDLFTPTNSVKGNKKLTRKIGLITMDEAVYAGGFGGTSNDNYYLNVDYDYWTMTPSYNNSGETSIFNIYSSGDINPDAVNLTNPGVRPVINIRFDVKLSGSGTSSNPYQVVGAPEPEKIKAKDTILANIKTITTRSSFNNTVKESSTGTMYTTKDNDGDSYYFAGAPTDNYVKFANLYWRIVRINGDGTVRLIYQGTSASATGANTIVLSNIPFNTKANNNAFVGYMYTSGSVHGVGTSSNIKSELDTWYKNNLANYNSYIDIDAGFCGDRTPYTDRAGNTSGGGTGTTETSYGSYIRLNASDSISNVNPTLNCANSSDLYTVSGASKGNKTLNHPIGLITADEVAYAGGVVGIGNNSYYLYNNQYYWTISPRRYDGLIAYVYLVSSDGSIGYYNTNQSTTGVRPVINLRADVTLSGAGTTSNPYTVS